MNAFEKKDVKVLEEFFHPNVVFRNYGDKEVRGREELLKVWSHVFGMFERVRFETVNQATNENIVIAEFLKVPRQRRIALPKRWSAMSMHPSAGISPLP